MIALWLIKLARKLTTWGFADDYLEMAEEYLITKELEALDWDYSDTYESETLTDTTETDG